MEVRRLGLASLLALGLLPGTARAACNLIPVARSSYASTLGGVESPITAPGKAVQIKVSACDVTPGFDPVPANNVVTLDFQPSGGPPTSDVPATVVGVADCTLPGGGCSTLSFTTPDTTGAFPPNGLAGPARIAVHVGSNLVADVGPLFLPTTGCDQEPEQTFRQFTVLPRANVMQTLIDGTAPAVLATVDGGGDLVVPLDYWAGGTASVLAATPGAPVAIFLRGSAILGAASATDPTTIAAVLAAQPDPSSFVRSFTLDGRPLPPLLRLTDAGELIGTADAVESVLRIARNDGAGGKNLYDLHDRLSDGGRGPIVIDAYSAARGVPVPIGTLRAAPQGVSFARDESREMIDLNGDGDQMDLVVELVDPLTGVQTNTGIALADLSIPGLLVSTNAIAADGNEIAFLESELAQHTDRNLDGDEGDNFVRAYRADGTELTATASAGDVEAAVETLIDGHPLAVSADRVFFRGPGAFVETEREGIGGVTGLAAAEGIAMSPDGRHVYVVGVGDDAVAIFARDAATGALTFLQTVHVDFDPRQISNDVGGGSIAVSPDGHHVYVRSNHPVSTVSVFARDATTGLLTFVEAQTNGMNGVDGLGGQGDITVSPDGRHVYVASQTFIATPPGQNAVVVFSRNATTGALTFVESLAGVRTIAIVASPDGRNVYGGADDIDVYSRDATTGMLTPVESVPTTYGASALAISPDGRHVYQRSANLYDLEVYARDGLTGELTHVQDVTASPNGGGRPLVSPSGGRVYFAGGNLVAFDRNPATGMLVHVETRYGGLAGAPTFDSGSDGGGGFVISPDGRFLYLGNQATDSISVFRNDAAVAAFDLTTGARRAAGAIASQVAVAGARAAVLTPEELVGTDLNGDGDKADSVAQLVDTTGTMDQVTPLGLAANRIAISDQLVAMTVPEAQQGNLDRNGDGDKDDDVLAVYEIGTPGPPINLGVAADKIAVFGLNVVFSRPEAKEPPTAPGCMPTVPPGGCDLNGDGDSTDRVLSIYRHVPGGIGTITPVRAPLGSLGVISDNLGEFEISGSLVAYLVDESAAETDLNGDGDMSDLVVQVIDLAADAGTPINTAVAAFPCFLAGCDGLRHYRVDDQRGTISFLVYEPEQGQDLDGDGDALDFVLDVFNLRSRRHHVTKVLDNASTADPSLDIPILPGNLFDGEVLYTRATETDYGVDLNGDGTITGETQVLLSADSDNDGVFDDFDTCVDAPNSDEVDVDHDHLGDTRCDPNSAVCGPTPLAGCQPAEPGGSLIALKRGATASHDVFKWAWKGSPTTFADLGDPVAGLAHYSICTYDGSAQAEPVTRTAIVPDRVCNPKRKTACWQRTRSGLKFKDTGGYPEGIRTGTLVPGPRDARMKFAGKGASLRLPGLPLTLPVRTQIVVREGNRQECWEAVYSGASANDGVQFKAKSD